jgi:putative transposase
VRIIHRHQVMDDVLAMVVRATGLDNIVQSAGRISRIVMSVLYEYAGMNNREIGSLVGVDFATVSRGRKRLREKSLKDLNI